MVEKDTVDLSQHTRYVLVDVDDTHAVWLVECQASQIDFWQVDGTECGSFVYVADECCADFDTNGGLRFFGAAADVRSEDDVLQTDKVLGPGV